MKLYARIWLAVVGTIAAFAVVVSVLWQNHTDHLREQFRNQTVDMSQREGQRGIEVLNEAGQVVGRATRRVEPLFPAGNPMDADAPPMPPRTRGFEVRLDNGQKLNLIMPPRMPRPPRPPPPWYFSGYGFLGLLGLMAIAVGLGAYPIVRRLTRRLEALQHGVDQWGAGHLSARVPVEGTDEVAYLAQKFNHAASQVESLVGAHKSLLANASHELRSPLARIRMALALLQATPDKASEATMDEIKRNIQELDSLIEEILLASRLDSPEASIGEPESFDLMGLAAEECARTSAELIVADGALGSFEMIGYPRLLRRLLRNLLENASRHNQVDKGGVSLALTRDASNLVPTFVIAVQDHGAGVSTEECERIFEPFYRAKNASERDGGVGLGLALVKTIALRHGGSSVCIPTHGAGGRFVVKLAASSHVGG